MSSNNLEILIFLYIFALVRKIGYSGIDQQRN